LSHISLKKQKNIRCLVLKVLFCIKRKKKQDIINNKQLFLKLCNFDFVAMLVDLSFIDQTLISSVALIKIVTNLSLRTTSYILKSVCIFLKVLYALKSFKLIMIFQLLDILDLTRQENLFLEIFGGFKCIKLLKTFYYLVTYVLNYKINDIVYMSCYNYYLFETSCGFLFLWISSPTYHHQVFLILYLLWLTNW